MKAETIAKTENRGRGDEDGLKKVLSKKKKEGGLYRLLLENKGLQKGH